MKVENYKQLLKEQAKANQRIKAIFWGGLIGAIIGYRIYCLDVWNNDKMDFLPVEVMTLGGALPGIFIRGIRF